MGTTAFQYSLITDSQGNSIQLGNHDFTVFYFYPQDDTPGCTVEAKEFQGLKTEYAGENIRILGVSKDGADSHNAFCEKFSLSFELGTDKEGVLGKQLGIFESKHKRSTFVLDKQGFVCLQYPQVVAKGHAAEVLRDIRVVKKNPTDANQ